MNPSDLLEHAAAKARQAAVFGDVALTRGGLECDAKAPAAPAWYRLSFDAGRLWVSVVTADRWLSHSIEADLLNTGDKVEELISEELAELGVEATVTTEHFRSEDKLFTFRTAVPVNAASPSPADPDTAAVYLLAYEACFRNLGDMNTDKD